MKHFSILLIFLSLFVYSYSQNYINLTINPYKAIDVLEGEVYVIEAEELVSSGAIVHVTTNDSNCTIQNIFKGIKGNNGEKNFISTHSIFNFNYDYTYKSVTTILDSQSLVFIEGKSFYVSKAFIDVVYMKRNPLFSSD